MNCCESRSIKGNLFLRDKYELQEGMGRGLADFV